ncbi:unnamed protein product [Prorocentrum cordatum]|uniref:V-type proton ATPase subunit a n=1 Tax=Prorocentrum cordatum TaxID=2364126 RepID=A0ABN9U1B6_9DINO|nr:unnamed protein product [Polarella glacialis]
MASFLRSQEMKYGVLVLPVQDSRQYIEKLGGPEVNVQFEDMKDMRRPFRKHVQRIDEMERIIRWLNEEIKKAGPVSITKQRVNEFFAADSSGAYTLDSIEAELKRLYDTFVGLKGRNDALQDAHAKTEEELQVTQEAVRLMSSGSSGDSPADLGLEAPLMGEDGGVSRLLDSLTGVVSLENKARLHSALWKAGRSNAYAIFSDTCFGETTKKCVFVVYFGQAATTDYVKTKIRKVCQAFGANLYDWPTNFTTAEGRKVALQIKLQEQKTVLEAHKSFVAGEIAELVAPASSAMDSNSKIEDWRLFCMKEKSIYSVLNMCQGDASLQVNVWYPKIEEDNIKGLLRSHKTSTGDVAFLQSVKSPPGAMPPTFIRSNDFTAPWQQVVDTYGVPKYQEANPAVFTTISFPFIFGMMYGDIGHGTLLLCFGIFLVMKADAFKYSQPVLYMMRYMVLSMGFFAVFAGFMYNDLFAMALPLFQSRFHSQGTGPADCKECDDWQPNHNPPWKDPMGPYPFGLDWAWEGASNQLVFVNSLKMKLSVLFGVMQMTVGVLLRWSNAFYWRSMTDFICECVPMMVFMVCFFGWMDWMILYKWTHFIDAPPSIINSLICMAMGQEDTMPLWEGSTDIAKLFMKLSMAAVPVMLLPKPFILLSQHKAEERKKKSKDGHELLDEEAAASGHHHGHGHGEFEFGEVFIHQVIETIEYVLGTVSHTASYLRIWALSLAHQQLSAVFFQKTLLMGLSLPYPVNGIALYILFTIWFAVTLGVLLGMDVLECFLHTLRLHWVEFQSKFYNSGGEGGVKFTPFDLRKLIEEADE